MIAAIVIGILLCLSGAQSATLKFTSELEREGIDAALKLAAQNLKPAIRSAPFPCRPISTPHPVPKSVHRLRPGDIQVVAALGDSLTAGTGGLARSYVGMPIEYRGMAFPIGGDPYRYTLPNFLRFYNPNLTGFARGVGFGNYGDDQKLDEAVPGAQSIGLISQAEKLVEDMRKNPSIDFQKDWKLITVFIGSNDLCKACDNPKEYSASKFRARMTAVLDFLKENVPRAFISLLQPLDVYLVPQLKFSVFCRVAHVFECQCALDKSRQTRALTGAYHAALESLTASGRYDDKEDFTVVLQPFFERPILPPRSFFSLDCFHFHAQGHASAAVNYWNSLFTPVGRKARIWHPKNVFKCPTPEEPYLYTSKNSH